MNKKIIIADDHFVVRAGTSIILESHFKDIEIYYAKNYTEVLELVKTMKIDLIILDINMPESKYLQMIKEIKEIHSDIKIMVFSVYAEDIAVKYIMEGAEGYINKLSDESKIIEAVESIFTNGFYYSYNILNKIKNITTNKEPINPIELLSKREKEIYDLLILGYGNLEISNTLDIHISTISTYKNRIFSKLKVKTLADLIKLNYQYSGMNNL